jgi:isoleucyl-tRNA synthetase
MTFTCDEAWEFLPPVAARESSVHLALFLPSSEIAPAAPDPFLEDWKRLFTLRDEVLKGLEEARQEKRIGKALEAKIHITAPTAEFEFLQEYESSLKELFNVSQVELAEDDTRALVTLAADGVKCERCWNFRTDIGVDDRWPTVCGRCSEALEEIVPLMQEQAAQEAAQ